jgi:hypothetical protein
MLMKKHLIVVDVDLTPACNPIKEPTFPTLWEIGKKAEEITITPKELTVQQYHLCQKVSDD